MMAGGLHGIREGLELPAGVRGQRLRRRLRARARAPWPRPATSSRRQRRRPGGLRRRGRRPLRQRRRTSSSRPSTPRSPTGSGSAASRGCDPPTMSTTYAHDVINPATEQVVTTVDLVGLEETDAAIARAVEVGPAWRAVSPADRGDAAAPLRGRRRGLDRRARRASRSPTPATPSATPAGRSGNVVGVLRYYSAAPERLFGRQIPVAGGLDVTFKEPLGVVSVIVPWNFPMPIAGWGLAPGARGRQHRRAQARRADPADRDAPRPSWPSTPASRRACSPCCPARARSWASGS